MADTTIAGIATGSDDFNILVNALGAAGLVDTLDAEGADLTVFAPTDAAFTQLASDLGYRGDIQDETAVFDFLVFALTGLGGGDPIAPLTDILTYHVSPGTKDLAAISALETVDTLFEGQTITPNGLTLIDNEPDLINPALVQTDLEATNGIVHVIDRVLLPLDLEGNDVPTITGLVAASGDGPDANGEDFDLLLAAVQAAGLAETLDAADADLTVFAPNDDAFVQLALDLGFDGTDEQGALDFILAALSDLGGGDFTAPLTQILTYHVSPEAKQLAQIAPLDTVATLEGNTIGVDGTVLVDLEPDIIDPALIATDIQTANGVVHVVDRVLLPLDLEGNDVPTITGLVAASGDGPDDDNTDFDLLLASVQAAGLADTLDAEDADLTVFAPTDAAFLQLATDLGFTGTDEQGALDFILAALSDLGGGDFTAPLTQILTYHVSPDAKQLAQIEQLETVETLEGNTIGVDGAVLVDLEPDIIDPALVATDIQAANGVVHAIDRVLLPLDLEGNDVPTIAGTVAASGDGPDDDNTDFDLLNAALDTAGLTGALDAADADLTVFAPTDAAFVQLATNLGFTGTDEQGALDFIVTALTELGRGDPLPLLSEILLYHVAPDAQQLAQLSLVDSVETQQGGSVGIDGTTLVDQEPDLPDPQLVATDIQASNGIIHAIDNVLLPLDIPETNGRDKVVLLVGDDDGDRLKGRNDNDVLLGGDGNDFLRARNGDDTLDGGAGNDRLLAHNGDDVLFGGEGDDGLFAGRGDDILNGGEGDDFLKGGRGDDILNGGEGDDFLKGGRGADTFVFASGDGHDFVRDFRQKQGDLLDVSGLGITSLEEFVAASVEDGRDLIFTDQGTGETIFFRRLDIEDLSDADFVFA